MLLRRLLTPLVAAALLVAAGCGGSSQGGNAPSTDNPMTMTVADVAGIPSAFLKYGKRKGFFQQHGLKLKVDTGAGGSAIIPGVVSGTYDVGGSNIMSVELAASKGVPIKMVTAGTSARTTPEKAFGAILVRPDSGITEAADLKGKTVAVNTLDGIAELTTKISLENHGVDPSTVKLTELGFPNMLAALNEGRVDAVWEIEPFLTLGLQSGKKPIIYPYLETKPGMQVGSYVTSKQYLAENSEAIKAFQAGVVDTAAAISKDPKAFRSALPQLTELSTEDAAKMRLPQWKGSVDRASLELIDKKLVKYGYIDEPVNIDEMLAPGAAK